jgi:hypothetical protein
MRARPSGRSYDMSDGRQRLTGCGAFVAHQRDKTASEVHWCQQYAAINHIALQRLVEQYDRGSCSNAGARFLKVRPAPSCCSAAHVCFGHKAPAGWQDDG